MRIKFDGNTYAIAFSRSERKVKLPSGRKIRFPAVTHCTIRKEVSPRQWVDVAAGETKWHSQLDRYDKGRGRREALGRALSQFEDESFREEVWRTYAQQHRDPEMAYLREQ